MVLSQLSKFGCEPVVNCQFPFVFQPGRKCTTCNWRGVVETVFNEDSRRGSISNSSTVQTVQVSTVVEERLNQHNKKVVVHSYTGK